MTRERSGYTHHMRAETLRALFLRERHRFARRYPGVASASLVLLDRACPMPPCAGRDLAAADLDAGVVFLARRALRRPRATLVALLRHELGHLADPAPSRRGAEQRADDIAGLVTGRRIRYDRHDVQTVNVRGRWPRPPHLPR